MLLVLSESLKSAMGQLVIIVLALGCAATSIQVILFFPVCFNWRHARNLHAVSAVMTFGAAFFLFVVALRSRMFVLGAMSGSTTVSLQTVEARKGNLLEVFTWLSSAFWLLAFVGMVLVRWWEILERRDRKLAATKAEIDKQKKAEADKRAAEVARSRPMKAEEAVLQQLAAAQM